MKNYGKNRLPSPPPRRRVARLERRPGASTIERTRGMVREHDERERPFDPRQRGSWRGSSRDLVVNGKVSLPAAGDDSVLRYVDVDGYKLLTWELRPTRRYATGQEKLGYAFFAPGGELLFIGDDYGNAPGQAIDSDDSLRGLLGFLTLKPGDTDPDYFDNYTPEQMAFARGDAEMISIWSLEDDDAPAFRDLEWEVGHLNRNGSEEDQDVPHILRPINFRYNDPPEENGDSIRYGSFDPGQQDRGTPQWYQVDYATGSDYSGGTVHLSNYNVLTEMLKEAHPDGSPAVWGTARGGHGTYAVLVVWSLLDESIKETLNALTDYPLISDDDHSHLEYEQSVEAWESWGRSDFEKYFLKHLNSQIDDGEVDEWPDGVDSYSAFNIGRAVANVDWEDQEGSGMWIDMDRAADAAVDVVLGTKKPSWLSTDMVKDIEELREALGLEIK